MGVLSNTYGCSTHEWAFLDYATGIYSTYVLSTFKKLLWIALTRANVATKEV